MRVIQDKINALEFEIAELKAENKEYAGLLDEGNELIKRFIEDTSALEKENKELKANNERLCASIKGMTEVSFSQRVKMEDLQDQVKRARKYADEFSDDSAGLRLLNHKLSEEKKELKAELQDAENRLNFDSNGHA